MTRNPGIDIEYSEILPDPDWDSFLAGLADAHFEQTSLWGVVRGNYGWQTVRWVARKNGTVVGGLQLQTRKLGKLGEIGYVIRGPMTQCGEEKIQEHLVDALNDYCQRRGLIYVVFDLPYPDRGLSEVLDKKGYGLHPNGIPPSGLIRATLLLDLRQSLDELTKAMFPYVRRNIRIGRNSGLTFGMGCAEHIDTFWELMLAICRRRGSAPTPSYPDFFRKLWQAMGSSGFVKLFLIRHGEEIVSAAVAFAVGDTVRVWKVGWSGAYGSKCPNHLMWWSIICWAKEKGFRQMDFVWIDEEDAVLVASGERRPERFRDGATFFKIGFGGRLMWVPRARSRFFKSAFRPFNRQRIRKLFETDMARKLLAWVWRSQQVG